MLVKMYLDEEFIKWIRNKIKMYHITLNIDNNNNKAVIYNRKNETINPKSRYIDLRYHKIRELMKEGKIDLKYSKS